MISVRALSLFLLAALVACGAPVPPAGVDGGARDAGQGSAVDAGQQAGGNGAVDAGQDAGASDSGVSDSGVSDGGVVDAGEPDAGAPLDGGSPDGGAQDGGTGNDGGSPVPDAGMGPPGVDGAAIVTFSLPVALPCGASQAASVTVRNTGTSAWDAATFKLGTVGDSDPFYTQDTRAYMPPGTTVAPGAEHTFDFTLVAPALPGTYLTDWQMVHEGVHWFGATAQQSVQVQCSVPADASTMTGKLMFGYQGWFLAPGDGSQVNAWVHWFSGNAPDGAHATTDLWPDVSELGPAERFDTNMTLPGGAPAQAYSAFVPATVDRHFAWMEDAGLDGVFLQRFVSEFGDPAFKAARDQVLGNVRAAAEAHGRVFAVEYDISGADPSTLEAVLEADWAYLVDTLQVTSSPRYLRHHGKPVLALWGFGVVGRPGTPAQAAAVISWLRSNPNPAYEVTLVGGVPHEWRFLNGDSQADPAWASVYRSYDVITPWTVGAYANNAGADNYKQNRLIPDMNAAAAAGREYMPTIWPGFSWKNLVGGQLNAIPRNGGQFYWRQAYNAASAGAPMVFNAMFDECDEGTAMFKVAPTAAQLPAQGSYLALDADGYALPSDWYLRLGGAATRMISGQAPLTSQIPITP